MGSPVQPEHSISWLKLHSLSESDERGHQTLLRNTCARISPTSSSCPLPQTLSNPVWTIGALHWWLHHCWKSRVATGSGERGKPQSLLSCWLPRGTAHRSSNSPKNYFEDDDAEAPHIAFGVILLSHEDLRSHVDGGSNDAGDELFLSVDFFGETEVPDFNSIACQHYIVRFQVPVYDSLAH